jgi:proline iminopeptidase
MYGHPPTDRGGFIEVAGSASIYWEESGAPNGLPALWLHGGPGGSIGTGWHRALFDPLRYRLISLDQRGCGRSRRSGDAPIDLSHPTTEQLIDDLEVVRAALGVPRWVLGGISWGTTLALAYAEQHPERVSALALAAITTTSRDEVEWITEGVGRFFPVEWSAFERASARRQGERIVDAYARRLASDDRADREAAARDWDIWESVHVSLDHPETRGSGHVGPERRVDFATLVTHYWSNDAFLPGPKAILERLHRIAHIPAALVHGRRDLSSPPVTAWRLHQALPASSLVIVEDEAHGGPKSNAALMAALDAFASSA